MGWTHRRPLLQEQVERSFLFENSGAEKSTAMAFDQESKVGMRKTFLGRINLELTASGSAKSRRLL